MNRTLRALGTAAIGLTLMAALCFASLFFVKGAAWIAERILPGLNAVSSVALATVLFVFLPLGIFRNARAISGVCLYLSSFLFGATLWMWSFLAVHTVWGTTGLVIGLLLGGVGVVPLAMIAALTNGFWGPLFSLLLVSAGVYGLRILGMYWAASEAEASRPLQVCGTSTTTVLRDVRDEQIRSSGSTFAAPGDSTVCTLESPIFAALMMKGAIVLDREPNIPRKEWDAEVLRGTPLEMYSHQLYAAALAYLEIARAINVPPSVETMAKLFPVRPIARRPMLP
jgi:hypothetical protein